ncbi:MAG: hypothetical protein A3C81_00100 [Candidatus Yanofskybacteria bacterium RIFCSPHIGHO2_02_FULL_46_19]|uniref:Trigger factor n=1 Tax=Candidatus Yanofskybacteria bacterium RIFCSPHIGHO2_02_FULL_46_19 TaxID=1802684 RepID=A0A1F8FSC2_9BACT|nr:MAG: hypothetical protein A3C81_00100 [Candidatus Yanofskybacteria bacterium RIFCSPHIGHO2_02_FULL_46_19]
MIEVKKLPESKVEITAEISADEFNHAFVEAIREAQKNLELPGFRKGMVPEKQVIAHIGEENLLVDAAKRALNKHWDHLIKEANIEPMGRPDVSLTKIAKGNPLGFKIIVSVLEEITLPDYKAIAKETISTHLPNIEVTDEEVSKIFDYIKQNNKNLPPDADEKKLKDAISQNIRFEKETKERDKRRVTVLEAIAKKSSVIVPDVVVDAELEKMLEELQTSLKQMGLTWEQYLSQIKKTEAELRIAWRADAQKRATFGLVLREIMKKENINPPDEIAHSKTEEMLRAMSEEERNKTSRERVSDYVRGRLLHEMVFDLLEKG